MLSSSIEVGIVRERSAQTNVLILEDEGRGRGVEENVAIAAALDGEGEWRECVVEDQLAGVVAGSRANWAFEDGFGNLVDLLGSVFNEDVKTSVCVDVLVSFMWKSMSIV
jgi:hypothetical protein